MKKLKRYLCASLCIVFSLFSYAQYSISHAQSDKRDVSGNHQFGIIETPISDSIVCTVTDSFGNAAEGIPVAFELINSPNRAQGSFMFDTLVYTDKNGRAATLFQLGDKEGVYEIASYVLSDNSKDICIFTLHAQRSNWIFFLILGLFGGLLIFLFGLELMSTGLQKAAGNKMRSILSTLTNSNIIGLSVGAVVTMIIQSSSATSVMLVSFVNSGLMRFKQSLSIILGASIGTTITAQIIAFKLTDYSLGIIAIGGALYMFANKQIFRNWGETIFGFGILFFGMEIMSDSMSPLRSYTPFLELLYSLENPILGILVGALFTALIQSSSAFIGIMIILASQGLLSLESSIALLLGANLGTPVTAILASIKANTEAKRVAYAQLVSKVFLVLLFIGIIPLITDFLNSGIDATADTGDVLPRQIANAHTIFNLSVAIILLPFLKQFEKLMYKLLPSHTVPIVSNTRYIDKDMISQPALAMQLAKEETIRLARKIQVSLELIIAPFLENDPKYLKNLEEQRETAKSIRDEIRSYLLSINLSENSQSRVQELFAIQKVLTELSHINDELTKVLHRRAEKWIERNYEFTEAERKEITDFHNHSIQLFTSAIHCFGEQNINDVFRIKNEASKQAKSALEIEKAHFMRLLEHEKQEMTNTKTYLELIHMLKTISSHAVNISQSTPQ
ncbi:MAG: Na/Pi symporter [Bacteroidales bacterium]|jgi:phosphate:Na+ symporter|nr:Na/Pi symporter [Bacteroidales bacterium]